MRSLMDIRDRTNERVATLNETIKNFDEKIAEYKTQLQGAGFPVETFAIKGRQIKLIQEKKWYQKECDKLNSQVLDINRLIFASEAFQHAQQMVSDLEAARTELNAMTNNLPHNMKGLVDASNVLIESLIQGHTVPDASNEILESLIQGHGHPPILPDDCMGRLGTFKSQTKK
ncbi:uncharacterized protein LOC111920484 [Lactuca sativa]|uniref:uncharacterized protein LOC111920484 n=1 Tax=Lactuca sativa TaxID=4236 RepID=UPI000CD82F19|nr:uncharacterized protein LOC111920484 [Lactuca sativa]